MIRTVNPWAIVTAGSSGSIMLTSCVSSNAKTMPVNGERMVPPRIAPMLTSGQKPIPSAGRIHASTPPSAPPIIRSGANTPPDVPDPSEIDQMTDLTIKNGFDRFGDSVPANALRSVPRDHADREGANHRDDDHQRAELMRLGGNQCCAE